MAIKVLFETLLTDIKDTDVEGVGILRYDDNGNVYRWVKNRDSAVMVQHEASCYDVSNADGTGDVFQSVNDPVTADLMLAAGINMAAAEISGGKCFFWVQVLGIHQNALVLDISGSAVAVGDELNCANGVGTITRVIAVGTAPIRFNTFFALETSSGDTGATVAKDVLVRCL